MPVSQADSLGRFESWTEPAPAATEALIPPSRVWTGGGLARSPDTPAPRFGPYELLRLLGAGGMAEVFEARRVGRLGVSPRVAIKRLLPHISRQRPFVLMFAREAALYSRLNHPGLLQIHEFDRADGQYYIAMELVDGCDLSELLAYLVSTGQPLPLSVVADILAQALEALSHAHRAVDEHGKPLDLVHRDIKPSNLLLSAAGQVKLADFGLARAQGAFYQTRTNSQLKGTLRYMAPESVSLETSGQSVDLYALGVVLYEMLTLKPFIEPGATMATMVRIITGRSLETLLEAIPAPAREFQVLVRMALARSPIQRYGSADEMLDDLNAIRGGLPAGPDLRVFMAQHAGGLEVYRREERGI